MHEPFQMKLYFAFSLALPFDGAGAPKRIILDACIFSNRVFGLHSFIMFARRRFLTAPFAVASGLGMNDMGKGLPFLSLAMFSLYYTSYC